MRENIKMAKLVMRNPHFHCGTKAFAGSYEKALSQDEDHKPYVRPSRNASNLPDSWDDTKWILVKRYRCWKDRVKKQKQWEPHWSSMREWKWLRGIEDWWDAYGGTLSTTKKIPYEPVPVQDQNSWVIKSKADKAKFYE
jgi:hypothetical protein